MRLPFRDHLGCRVSERSTPAILEDKSLRDRAAVCVVLTDTSGIGDGFTWVTART